MGPLPSDNESDDGLDKLPVPNGARSEDDDQVTHRLELETLTKYPSSQDQERTSRKAAEETDQSLPVVSNVERFVDEGVLKERTLVFKETDKKQSLWKIPTASVLHAAFRDRSGQLLPYLKVDPQVLEHHTLAEMKKALKNIVSEHGAEAVAERCIFVSGNNGKSKPGAVMFLPVVFSPVDSTDHVREPGVVDALGPLLDELTEGSRVPCLPIPKETMHELKAALTNIPAEFHKTNGDYELVDCSKKLHEAGWERVGTNAGEKRKAPKGHEKSRALAPYVAPSPGGASPSTSLETLGTPLDGPHAPGALVSESGEPGEEVMHTMKSVKRFCAAEEPIKKEFVFQVPAHHTLTLTWELNKRIA